MTEFILKLRALRQIWRRFENPFLVTMLRFGFLRLPFFSYRIRLSDGKPVTMLARPGTTSLADLFVLREVFVEQTYKDVLPLLPSRAVTAMDVGANLGSFCVWIAANHGISKASCFEPDPSSFRLCQFNLAANGCTQVEPVPKAVGGLERTLTMRVNTSRPGGNSIYAEHSADDETAEIQVVPLDKWMAQTPGSIDILKLDCEGAEWEILEHTPLETWQRFGLIVAEVHGDARQKYQPDDFPKMMESRGFETKRWDGGHMGIYIGVRTKPVSPRQQGT